MRAVLVGAALALSAGPSQAQSVEDVCRAALEEAYAHAIMMQDILGIIADYQSEIMSPDVGIYGDTRDEVWDLTRAMEADVVSRGRQELDRAKAHLEYLQGVCPLD